MFLVPDHERRHARHVAEIAGGIAVLGMGTLLLAERRDVVPDWEQRVFEAINGLPEALRPVLYVEMQLGAFWAIPVVAGAMFATGRRRGALTAAAAGLAAWGAAKAVKAVIQRGRPAELLVDPHVREANITGLGFISGHTAVAFALATAVTPYLKGGWRIVPITLASLVGLSRIYIGAHLPLDVVGGVGVGVACGSSAAWIFGRP